MLNTAITISTGEPDATENGHVRFGGGPSEKDQPNWHLVGGLPYRTAGSGGDHAEKDPLTRAPRRVVDPTQWILLGWLLLGGLVDPRVLGQVWWVGPVGEPFGVLCVGAVKGGLASCVDLGRGSVVD